MADFSVWSTDFWRTIDTSHSIRALWNSIDNVSSDSEHVDKRQYHNVLFVFDTIPFNMHQRSSFDCGNVLIWLPVNSFDKIPIKINLIGLLYNFRKILWWIYDKIFHHVLVSNIMHSRITISKWIKMVCSPLWNPL